MKYRYSYLLALLTVLGTLKGQDRSSREKLYFDSLLAKANKVYYSDPDLSARYASEALDYARERKLEVQKGQAWYSMARTEILKGDIEPALDHLKDAAAVFQEHDQKEHLAKCYDLMSTAISKLGKDNPEIAYLLQRAAELYRKADNKKGLRASLMNLANYYAHSGEYEKGLQTLEEAKTYIGNQHTEWFYYYINTGLIFMKQERFAKAQAEFDSARVISHRYKMTDAEVTAITELAAVYRLKGNYQEAILHYTKAIEMARANTLPLEESDALSGLIPCYERTNNYKSAFQAQRRLNVISDSLFDLKKVQNITAIEKKLMVSEKEKTIALQKLSMEESARLQEASNRRMTWLVSGALFLAICLFFTVFIYVRTERQKREIETQKATVERLNSLNQKIFSVIAHDFKSPLITLQMLTDLLDMEHISQNELSAYTADVRNQITQSNQILENLLNWARTELNVAQNKNASADPQLVAGEIGKELNFMASRKNVRLVNALPPGKLFRIPPDILKIVTRNLVSNAIKFSYENSEVEIGLRGNNLIYVKDTGVGMSGQKLNELFTGTVKSKLGTFNETGFGLGLYITYELISKFRGKIRVEANKPAGSVFIFELPLYE